MASSRSELSVIADRYASALVALASDASAQDRLVSELSALSAALRADAALTKLLAHPLLSRTQKAAALAGFLEGKGAHDLTKRAVAQLAKAGRLALIPALAEAVEARIDRARGVVQAVVTSARALSKEQVQALKTTLAQAAGTEVRLSFREDATLLGGLKIKLGSRELDASVAGQLEKIKRALIAA